MRTELRNKRVLLIEDHTAAHETLSDLLELAEANVISAYSGNDGLNLARTQRPDLIICNYTLPYLNGLEILDALKKDAATEAIPFILLAVSPSIELKEQSVRLGARAFLLKDLDPLHFIDLVSDVLARID